LYPGSFLPFAVTSNPTIKGFLDILGKYAPGTSPSNSGLGGYASWLVFKYALERVTADNVTSADIYNALNTIKNQDFGGFTAPLTYKADQPHPSPVCWWNQKTVNGVWLSPDNGKRNCA
jgi:hypothetical protein